MMISPHLRIATHAAGREAASAHIRRWAVVRLILGVLQMLGASLSLGVIVRGGVTPLAMTAVIITGMLTGISMMLFQVLRAGPQGARRRRSSQPMNPGILTREEP
jgi:hypothetical protein